MENLEIEIEELKKVVWIRGFMVKKGSGCVWRLRERDMP